MMLYLDIDHLIGKGRHRECYAHPENKNLCIKIVVAGEYEESLREQFYYKFLEKRNISWEMLSRWHGNIETNLGMGAVFDLIRDYNGDVSKTLEYYLSTTEDSDFSYHNLSQSLLSLKQYLIQQRIIPMTLKQKNIVFKKNNNGGGKFVIVDNIGNSDFIPICNHVGIFGRKKIERKWQRFVAVVCQNTIRSQIASIVTFK